jgi:electron transport complex protein RnfG
MSGKIDSPIKLGVSLAAIAAIAACLLAYTATLTREKIALVKGAKVTDALRQVLPDFDNDPAAAQVVEQQDGAEVVFYPAMQDGKLVGIAATAASPKGYGGVVSIMASLDPEGRIRTVIVTEQKETPGLGTVVTDRKRQKTLADVFGGAKAAVGLPPNSVLDQFTGRDCAAAPWKVGKDGGDVDQITGATVSSRAVTDAVNLAAQAFAAHREALLAAFAAANRKDAP